MIDAAINYWPLLLILALLGWYSFRIVRTLGSGKDGSYSALMKREIDLIEVQIELQNASLAEQKRLSEAVERIATVLERDGD